jgi:hypothetical protein
MHMLLTMPIIAAFNAYSAFNFGSLYSSYTFGVLHLEE